MEETFNQLKLKTCRGIPGYSWVETIKTGLHHNERQLTIIDAIQPYTDIHHSVYLLSCNNYAIFMSQRINQMLCKWFKLSTSCIALVRLRPGQYKCVHFSVSHAALRFWTPSFGEGFIQSEFPSFTYIRSSSIRGTFLCDFVILEIKHSGDLFDLAGSLTIANDNEVVFQKTFDCNDAVCVFKADCWSIFSISLSQNQEDINSCQFKTYLRQLHQRSKHPEEFPLSANSHRGSLQFQYSFDKSATTAYDWYILAEEN